MIYEGDAVSFAADVYQANARTRQAERERDFWHSRYDTQHGTVHRLEDEAERERKAVKYWRTEYLRAQRERDEAWAMLRKIAHGEESLAQVTAEIALENAPPPQREGDYL